MGPSICFLLLVSMICSLLALRTHGFVPCANFARKKAITINSNAYDVTSEIYIPSKVIPVEFCGAGCILLAQPNDGSHFFIRAAIFIYQYSKEEGAKGVILERPSAFTMGETSPGVGCFEANTLFIGGEQGSDTAIMLGRKPLEGACKYVGSGVYLGGMKSAKERVMNGDGVPKDYKFFFNHAEWEAGLLEREITDGKWDVIKAPPEDVLSQDPTKTEFWNRARNQLISEGLLKSESDA